jgi:hypothetical protein
MSCVNKVGEVKLVFLEDSSVLGEASVQSRSDQWYVLRCKEAVDSNE